MSDNTYNVYEHVNKTNGKRYIGMTRRDPKDRWGTHGQKYQSTPKFWEAIQSEGWDNFEHNVLATGLTHREACDMEAALVAKHNTQENGYNVASGGDHPTFPEESRRKLSLAMVGNKNGLGHPCSEEKRKKIGDAQRGRVMPLEQRQHISEAKRGKTHKPISQEARDKIAEKHVKSPVLCQETQYVYPSIQQCARDTGLEATSICACCKGRIKSIKGYHFTYLADVIKA